MVFTGSLGVGQQQLATQTLPIHLLGVDLFPGERTPLKAPPKKNFQPYFNAKSTGKSAERFDKLSGERAK